MKGNNKVSVCAVVYDNRGGHNENHRTIESDLFQSAFNLGYGFIQRFNEDFKGLSLSLDNISFSEWVVGKSDREQLIGYISINILELGLKEKKYQFRVRWEVGDNKMDVRFDYGYGGCCVEEIGQFNTTSDINDIIEDLLESIKGYLIAHYDQHQKISLALRKQMRKVRPKIKS
ncbi:MAG: hypothetical protein V1867_04585 [Candidatus Falkowbacteria bacterium]